MPFILGAASDYSCDPIRALIHDLKFRFRQEAAEPLSALLAHYTSPLVSLTNKTLVVPIPLSRERERVRGFNQSLLIARGLATHLHIPLRANILVRTKHTPPQTEQVHFADRHHNVQHCFKVLKPLSKETILLVDDVITSGATLKEAARTLKRAGAGAIIALTVARA
jgi:ComF family protein